MRLQTATWPEVEAYLEHSKGIIVPIGSTEQHGPNGMLGTDAICPETIAFGEAVYGFLICTEIWFTRHARDYGRHGAHIIVCPRVTPASSTDTWIAGGRTTAVVSGAFCLSSNLAGPNIPGSDFGGTGWVIEPEAGAVLGTTSASEPFLTMDIDIGWAEAAKSTYPRYVADGLDTLP